MVTRLLRHIAFRNTSATAYWLLIALAGRTAYYLLELHFMGQVAAPKGVWGIYYDDSYFAPIRNLIQYGSYTPDERMPGLGIIYLPLALLFSKITAFNIFIILQVLLSGISVYCLGITAKRAFNRDFFFYVVFYIFLLSPFTSISDCSPASESFCTSFLIFSVFYYQLAIQKRKGIYFVLSGLALTWASFIRPAHFPILMLFAGLIFIFLLRNKVKPVLLTSLFIAPFLLLEGAWITRNYIRYHKFLPTLNSIYLASCKDTYRYPIWQWERSWGREDWQIDWLIQKDSGNISKEKVDLPDIVYTSQYNADTLRAFKKFLNHAIIRYAYISQGETMYVDSVSPANKTIIENKCNIFINSLKKEKPFSYYVLSRLKLIKAYFKLSEFSNFQEPYMNMLGVIMYFFVLILGIAGIALLLPYMLKLSTTSLFAFIPLFSIFIHPVVLRLAQNRYLIPAYPFLVICASYTLYLLYCKAGKTTIFKEAINKIQKEFGHRI